MNAPGRSLALLLALSLACSARGGGGGGSDDAGSSIDSPTPGPDAPTTDAGAPSDTPAPSDLATPPDAPVAPDVPPPTDKPVAPSDSPDPPVDVPTPPVDVPPPPVDVPPPPVDVPTPPVDVPGPTMTPSQQIAAVRAALPGTTSLRVDGAVITYVLPVTRRDTGTVVANDPGGITVQAERTGPALFVAVDPATLSPAPRVGDRVRFTVNRVGGPMNQLGPWALAVSDYARTATGVSVAPWVQDVSAAADLVSNVRGYEHELIAAQLTVTGDFASAGTGFVQAPIATQALPASTLLRMRVTDAVRTTLGLRAGCTLRVQSTPMWRYDTTAQVSAWAPGDVSDLRCPPPDAGVPVDAGPPPSDRVWVLRVGDEVTPLSGGAAPVSIEAWDGETGVMVGSRIALPTAQSGSNYGLTLSGVATAEGSLARSLDGRWVTVGGYNLPVGTASVASTDGTRVIARINATGTVDSRTASGSFANTRGVRAVVSADGSAFWSVLASGSLGAIAYTGYGGAPSAEVSDRIVLRGLGLLPAQLLATGSNPDGSGVYALAPAPLPPARPTPATLPGFPATAALSPYGVVPIDRNGDGQPEALLLGDDRAILSGGGILVWTLSGGVWSQFGAVSGLPVGMRAITGRYDNGTYVVYGVTAEGRPRLLRVDISANTLVGNVRVLAAAPVNTAYRGVAFAPR